MEASIIKSKELKDLLETAKALYWDIVNIKQIEKEQIIVLQKNIPLRKIDIHVKGQTIIKVVYYFFLSNDTWVEVRLEKAYNNLVEIQIWLMGYRHITQEIEHSIFTVFKEIDIKEALRHFIIKLNPEILITEAGNLILK